MVSKKRPNAFVDRSAKRKGLPVGAYEKLLINMSLQEMIQRSGGKHNETTDSSSNQGDDTKN